MEKIHFIKTPGSAAFLLKIDARNSYYDDCTYAYIIPTIDFLARSQMIMEMVNSHKFKALRIYSLVAECKEIIFLNDFHIDHNADLIMDTSASFDTMEEVQILTQEEINNLSEGLKIENNKIRIYDKMVSFSAEINNIEIETELISLESLIEGKNKNEFKQG